MKLRNTAIALGVVVATAVVFLVANESKAESAKFYSRQAESKYKKGDYKGAVSDFYKAIEIDPNYVSAYGSLCGMLVNLYMDKEAIIFCDKALDIKEKNPSVTLTKVNKGIIYSNLCGARYNLEEYKQGLPDCEKAIKINPNNDIAYYNLANIKSTYLRDNKGAISDLDKAIRINNRNPLYFANRGILKEQLGNNKGACSDWRKASSLGDKESSEWVSKQC
ncbi:tetratricopeptide repeat protein [Prochlorococcus sp. MIT 1223]|uniref:tetratricopeptide repeat protein n=1 Tax=Prochlorococcus sp. MIT 1223 TaxID=3096217 RepID=UPI002A74CA78|nr:tetratricopeptide repeat protein [Prochlorococcus sp. MIT 1223]